MPRDVSEGDCRQESPLSRQKSRTSDETSPDPNQSTPLRGPLFSCGDSARADERIDPREPVPVEEKPARGTLPLRARFRGSTEIDFGHIARESGSTRSRTLFPLISQHQTPGSEIIR